jgi:hypothetical protein
MFSGYLEFQMMDNVHKASDSDNALMEGRGVGEHYQRSEQMCQTVTAQKQVIGETSTTQVTLTSWLCSCMDAIHQLNHDLQNML